jgi:ATP-dependent DNA ligase
MAIECNLWPMSILTKPVGSKDRKLIIHPKEAVLRAGIRRNPEGLLSIVDESMIKIPYGSYFPEVKECGHRHIYCRDANGNYHMYGRRLNVQGTYTDILPKIQRCPNLPKLPEETALDLELIYPGHPDAQVSSAIKDCPDKLQPIFFAVLIHKGEVLIGDNSMDYMSGRKLLESLVDKGNLATKFSATIFNKENRKHKLEVLLRYAEGMGQEGFVLKAAACDDWWKLKGLCEADVFVTGFKVSSAKTRMGMITAVEIGVYDDNGKIIDMGNVSGFPVEEMMKMMEAHTKFGTTKNNPYMFKVLRIIYQEMAAQGMLKHAFKDSWREDKNHTECLYSQFQ